MSSLLLSKSRQRLLELALPSVALGLALAVSVPAIGATPAATSYAVATESPTATREASRLLEAGGNAIDAAVCAALVAGFANPSSSGIGGGGFALVWSARDKAATIIDFRESAPAALDAAALEKRPVPNAQRGQLVGVPGEVAGLFELQQRFGRMPWKDVVTRAARLAGQGFATDAHTAHQLEEHKSGAVSRLPAFRSVYLPGGAPAKLGQRLRAPKLAKTLARIARDGKRGFYEGPVASDIVSAVQAAGGGLALTDLARYQPLEREPLRVSWGDKQVLTMPPPSAGGLLLAQTLALFSRTELRSMQATPAKRVHLLAEAMRGAFADRARYFGDPAFSPLDLDKLLSPARMAQRKARLSEDRTHTQPRFGLEEAGTHHLVTADGQGNWVSLTTTINNAFGAKLMAEQSGIILNDELYDFSTADSVAAFGMSESPNRPRAGARPVSSMSPTLVLQDGVPVLALGGSGALTIAPNVTQVLLNRLAFDQTPEAAVSAARFTIPSPRSGQTLWLESELNQLYGPDLAARGELLLSKNSKNAVQLVARHAGKLVAVADARKQGHAMMRNDDAPAGPAAQ